MKKLALFTILALASSQGLYADNPLKESLSEQAEKYGNKLQLADEFLTCVTSGGTAVALLQPRFFVSPGTASSFGGGAMGGSGSRLTGPGKLLIGLSLVRFALSAKKLNDSTK